MVKPWWSNSSGFYCHDTEPGHLRVPDSRLHAPTLTIRPNRPISELKSTLTETPQKGSMSFYSTDLYRGVIIPIFRNESIGQILRAGRVCLHHCRAHHTVDSAGFVRSDVRTLRDQDCTTQGCSPHGGSPPCGEEQSGPES